jgi:serine protease Do
MDTLTNRKSRRVITCICIITTAFILVSIFTVNKINILDADAQQTEVQNSANNTNNISTIGGSNTNISSTNVTLPPLTPNEIFSNVQDSVVQVTTTNRDIIGPLNSGLGSGFVYDTDGHIITNYHVVALTLSGDSSNNISSSNNNTDIVVTFNDGSVYNAKIVGSDRFSDIAVLRIENISASKLVPLTFGNSSQAEIGEQVVAIGNPFGLSGTLTVGVVSGLGRIIPSLPDQQEQEQQQPSLPENPFGGPFPDIPGLPFQQPPLIPDQGEQERTGAFSIPDIIQTDAAVNPGNSGGPLLNMEGQAIGMNTAIFSETGVYAGIGFAIPSNTITKVVPSLITSGSYQHPWLGLIGIDITPDIAKALGLSLDEANGFLIIGVNEGSPAAEAGIRGGDRVTDVNGREIRLGGDIVLKIDNQDVRKIEDILTYLEGQKHVGDTVQLTILRDGETQTVNATLTPRPESNQSQQLQSQSEQQQRPSLGISGTNLTPEIAKAMNITQPTGFLVVDIIADGPADNAGIRGGYLISNINGSETELGGDVILKIDNKTVNTIDDIISYLDTKKVNDTVQLSILRNGNVENVPVQLGPSSVTGGSTESPLEIQPSFPYQPPNNDSNSQQQSQSNSSSGLLNEFHNKCSETLGKSLCDQLFGQ